MKLHEIGLRSTVCLVLLALFCPRASAWAGGRVPWSITHLAIDPVSPSTLYAVAQIPPPAGTFPTTDGIFRSDDAGATWRPIATPTFDVSYPDGFRYIVALAVDPRVRGIVYAVAGTEGAFARSEVVWTEVFKSVDAGENWTEITGTPGPLTSLVIDPVVSDTLYAGVSSIPGPGGIFKSAAGGEDWFDVSPLILANPGFPLVPDAFVVLGVDSGHASVLYAGGSSIPVYRSNDAGDKWTPASSGFPNLPGSLIVSAFEIAPSSGAMLYAGTFGQGVYVSADSGGHWIPANTGIGSGSVLSLAVDPRSSSVAYAGTAAGLYKTSDRGVLWSPLGFGYAAINAITVDPSSSDIVYLGTSIGAFKSVDAGSSWTRINEGMHPVPLAFPVPPATPSPIHRHP